VPITWSPASPVRKVEFKYTSVVPYVRAFFHHQFYVRPSQTPARKPAMILRECIIQNSARLQRRFCKLPQNHFSALFDNLRGQRA